MELNRELKESHDLFNKHVVIFEPNSCFGVCHCGAVFRTELIGDKAIQVPLEKTLTTDYLYKFVRLNSTEKKLVREYLTAMEWFNTPERIKLKNEIIIGRFEDITLGDTIGGITHGNHR